MEQVSVLETNIGASTSGNSANTQIIFNDNGTLRGDAGLVYNKTTDTLTAGSATITGAATVGTTLGVTGASTLTGSVGIGAASSAKLSVTDANGIPLRFGDIATAPTSQTACFVGTATGGLSGSINGDLILAPRTSDVGSVVVYTGIGTSAERLRVTAAGNVNITTGNVVMGTANKGIDFSINSDASATSELLNDYEEGTWTPVLGGFGGTSGQTYSLQVGRYTKVGRQVICSFEATLTAVGTVTGDAIISGLPFSSVSTSNNTDGGTTTIGFANNLATNQIFITGYLNGTGAYSFITGTAAAGTVIGNITATNIFGNTTRLSGTITYTAS